MSKATDFQTRMRTEAASVRLALTSIRAYGPQQGLRRKIKEVIAIVVSVLVYYKWWSSW